MSELIQMIQEQQSDIKTLKQMVHQLTVLVMKDKVDTTWLNEDDAAATLGYKPDYLRRIVKTGKGLFADIKFRHTNGRNYQYSRKDILNFKRKTSNA